VFHINPMFQPEVNIRTRHIRVRDRQIRTRMSLRQNTKALLRRVNSSKWANTSSELSATSQRVVMRMST
jgi:hypothetical protein